MSGLSVKVIASALVTPDRQRLGWSPAAIAPARAVIANSPTTFDDALATCDANAVHIVEGIRGTRIARHALRRLVAARCRFGIISEGGDYRGIRGVARLCLYRALLWRLRGKIDFVLAMGELGVTSYLSCGVPSHRVFPFAYSAETPAAPVRSQRAGTSDAVFRIVYIGQCIERKGIHDLLEALERLPVDKVSLSIVGDGYLRGNLEETVSRSSRLRGRVDFTGAMPYLEAVGAIPSFDLLVLPSHFDGWGVVVNEALMRGVPVICSDMCGAKDLLAESWRGGVFRSGCTLALARELRSRVQAGPPSNEQRDRLKEWGRRLSGDTNARYFASILAHVYSHGDRPEAPWTD
jgi:glycosyltransferase involved in cell wall biosynthesis